MKRLLVWRLILSAVVLFSMLGFLSPLSVEGQTTYYAITLNKEGSGTVKFTSEGVDIPDITKVASGTNVKITLLPDEGYEVKFAEYIEGSAFSGTPFESGDLVRMYKNLTVNVKFAQKQVQPIRFYLPEAFSVQNGELMWGNGVTSVSQEFSPGEEMPLKARADVGYELDYIKVGDKPVQMIYSDATQTYSGKHLVSEEDRGKDISAAFKRKPDAPASYYIELREEYQYNGEDDGSGDDQSANIKGAKIDASGRKYVNIGDQLEVEILSKLPNWSVNVYVNLEEVIPNSEGLYKFQVGKNMISEDKLKVKVVFKESSEDPEPPQKYTVTIAKDAGEGSLSVKYLDENGRQITVKNGDMVLQGTDLFLVATPQGNNVLDYVKVNGAQIEMDPIAGTNQLEGSATVSAATNITYAFKEAAVEQVEVSFDAPANGTFSVKKGETYIETGSTVETGSELTLIAVANEGYELDKVMAGETSVAMTAGADRTYTGTYQADGNVTFVVTFKEAASPEPDAFKITHNVIGNGTLEFTDSEKERIEDLNNVPANTEVSIDAIPKNAFKDRLKSLKLTMGGEVTNFKVEDWDFS
ncbi:InlB B-repeat-containing protein, partial [Porphyromonas crevioricanis]